MCFPSKTEKFEHNFDENEHQNIENGPDEEKNEKKIWILDKISLDTYFFIFAVLFGITENSALQKKWKNLKIQFFRSIETHI